MRLATMRTADGKTRAVRVEDGDLVDLRADDLSESWRGPTGATSRGSGRAGARRRDPVQHSIRCTKAWQDHL